MRILIVSQFFDPEPTFKGLLFARELQRLGHEVEVLTGFPNYPGGKLYPGYRVRPWQREVMDGVPVLRVPLYPSHDGSGVRRAANYLSYAASASVGALLLRRPDVAYVYHPPATAALPAVVLRALRGVPFVYDIQDLWPDTLAATGMMQNAAVLRGVGGFMDRVHRRAARIAVLSPGFREKLIERGVPEHKVSVIPNWTNEDKTDLTLPPPERARELGFADRFNVVFAGNMGKAQALDTVLDAAEELRGEAARFVMIGGGVEEGRLRESARERGLTNVDFLPRRPPSEIGEILALADALLIHLKDDPLFAITIPGKTQANLRAGKPLLMGVRGDAAALVREAGAGLTFPPQDAAALAAAVRELMALSPDERRQMGERGARYYEEHLALRVGAARFAELLADAARGGSAYDPVKRVLDVLISGLGLAALGLPMLVLAAVVRSRLGSPVLFQQVRPGRYGDSFKMYKFRTMTDERGPDGELLPDGVRLTAFGRFLRSTSLDELPELFNVLKGDMSLVGPRPLLMEYLPRYTPRQARRHEVLPGITGWAQVNGRNALSWEQKFELDVWYVENRTLALDLRILCMTVAKVLRRDGISAAGDATMPIFKGSTTEGTL
ncbi:UDP-phosphate galactose phosphotransferase [Deinococcus sp. RL]|uniref:sugar transferase n=1 Tax=Deinococcus sp. RL TaxID=1489678 RepID=UPI0004D67FCE|nr:sugar transferase [Deinococcus sp. RL]KEF34220.1 UDP-phosphate galactose phosphotransferase [Deinococcus sp. RL]